MKRIIAVLMTITLAIGLCSCGKDAEPAAVPILTAEQIGRATFRKKQRTPSPPTKRAST